MVAHSFGSIYYRTLLCVAFPSQKSTEIMNFLGQKVEKIREARIYPVVTRIYPVLIPYFEGHPKKRGFAQETHREYGFWGLVPECKPCEFLKLEEGS